jgi:hypothetical protein
VVVGRGGFGTGARRVKGDWWRLRSRSRLADGEGPGVIWRKEVAPIDLNAPVMLLIVVQ